MNAESTSIAPKITIDPEFHALIPPLSTEEISLLECSIVNEGCRDPLVVWHETGILLDGHNRHAICQKYSVSYSIVELNFPDRDAAADWMDANQLGRRNLGPDQMSLLRGRRYNRAKKAHGGDRRSTDHSDTLNGETADRLADDHGVSAPTIKRDGAFAAAVEKLDSIFPDITKRVVSGTAPARKNVIKAAAIVETHPEKAAAILAGQAKAADVVREIERETDVAALKRLAAKDDKPMSGVYDVIVIDPPWPVAKSKNGSKSNRINLDFPTMTEDELAALKIPCAVDCHLWIWAPQTFLPMAFRLLDAWHLDYVCTFVWEMSGGSHPAGLPELNCEFAIYARRGNPTLSFQAKDAKTCFKARRGASGSKPAAFDQLFGQLAYGTRLQLFGPGAIGGFDVLQRAVAPNEGGNAPE